MWVPSNPTQPLDSTLISSSFPTPHTSQTSKPYGLCGRLCKPADTCYAFWAGASLHLLSDPHSNTKPLHDTAAMRSYLLTLTQHPVMGGFSKFPGDKWADLYHSYLGLAALSLCSSSEQRAEDGIKELDPGMCLSADARKRLEPVWEGLE